MEQFFSYLSISCPHPPRGKKIVTPKLPVSEITSGAVSTLKTFFLKKVAFAGCAGDMSTWELPRGKLQRLWPHSRACSYTQHTVQHLGEIKVQKADSSLSQHRLSACFLSSLIMETPPGASSRQVSGALKNHAPSSRQVPAEPDHSVSSFGMLYNE